MDNRIIEICPYCKKEGTVTNWFDEALDFESPRGDDDKIGDEDYE